MQQTWCKILNVQIKTSHAPSGINKVWTQVMLPQATAHRQELFQQGFNQKVIGKDVNNVSATTSRLCLTPESFNRTLGNTSTQTGF